MSTRKEAEKKMLLSAIHKNCLSCCGGYRNDIGKCDFLTCPLHPYRNGTIPPDLSVYKRKK